MLQVIGKENQPLIVMSLSAYQSLNKDQVKNLENQGEHWFFLSFLLLKNMEEEVQDV